MPSEVVVTFEPRGAGREVFSRRDPEVLLAGPAGTGKTRCALEKLHLCASKYPGMRGLMVRKTHASLTSTALVTYQQKVLHPLDGVTFYGGSAVEPPQFRYPNGSRIMIGGLDNPTKIMSAEYDLEYVNEATELTEDDWERLTTRLRNGVMPYQQILADCNPDAPSHWLKLRCDAGKVVMLESRHEDNPVYYDVKAREWTSVGGVYIGRLDALSGVRRLRLRFGTWAAAEGMVYEEWDRAIHLLDKTQLPVKEGARVCPAGIPLDWPRYWAVDFGFTNPFVWQAWAEDTDGRLYRYHEIYLTQHIVEDIVPFILAVTKGEPRPTAIICDHDAEDRATLERHLRMGTLNAYKRVSPGIQAVKARLRKAADGKARLFLVREALADRDALLVDARKPTCTEEEVESYIWNTAANRNKGEEPVKKDDHGCDAMRYLVAFVDSLADDPSNVDESVYYDEPVTISPF